LCKRVPILSDTSIGIIEHDSTGLYSALFIASKYLYSSAAFYRIIVL